ncbi:MAG: hypothetical protein CMG46_06815, partial [Candidatus Marinimicrobia bacterium]|nr:hypothetical protein [Candidatus Neomarinimicrobiota bacterium]
MRDRRFSGLAGGSMALLLISAVTAHAESNGRTFGFLAWDFGYASAEATPEACPEGLNTGARELYLGD